MHCEVAAILNDALRAASEQVAPATFAPERSAGGRTAGVLFPRAAKCRRGSRFSPPIFATKMATWCEDNVAQYLTLNPSSFGHLNVVTSSWFKQELLRRFVTQGAEALFSPTLLLYQPRFPSCGVAAN